MGPDLELSTVHIYLVLTQIIQTFVTCVSKPFLPPCLGILHTSI